MTTSERLARNWANMRVRRRSISDNKAVVLCFEIEREWLASLESLCFVRASEDFFDLVEDCRSGIPPLIPPPVLPLSQTREPSGQSASKHRPIPRAAMPSTPGPPISLVVQRDPPACLSRIQTASTRGVRTNIRRVAGFAPCSGSAGHAGATANIKLTKLTFRLDHSMWAAQWCSGTFHLAKAISFAAFTAPMPANKVNEDGPSTCDLVHLTRGKNGASFFKRLTLSDSLQVTDAACDNLLSVPDEEQAPRVFLSFASEDAWWVKSFTDRDLFGRQLGNVRVQNYTADENLSFGELKPWIDKQLDRATVIIAFVSKFYREKEWTLREWNGSLTEYQRRRLIFVPVLLDADAKAWWAKQREFGKLADLGNNFQYSDFTDSNGAAVEISGNDLARGKIVRLAQEIRKLLETPLEKPPSEPKSLELPFVILGHPTGRFSEDVERQCDALEEAAQGHGLRVCRWGDRWRTNISARDKSPASMFVQPLEPGDASDQVGNSGITGNRLTAAGFANSRVVLWLPSGQSDPDFAEAAARAASNAMPAIPDPWPGPALRNETPGELVRWLAYMVFPAPQHDAPLLQIETVGSPVGSNPDSEASRLSNQLSEDFCSIVKGVTTPEPSSPWRFWGDLFRQQVAVLPGSRAIVAVHDLDVKPSADLLAARKAIELKFHKMQSDVEDVLKPAGGLGKIRLFWTALILRNSRALPFADYPSDGRFKNWRLLRFEKATTGKMSPDPASLAVFRARLSEWLAS